MSPGWGAGHTVTVDIGRSGTRARVDPAGATSWDQGGLALTRFDQGGALRRAGGVDEVAGLVRRVVGAAPGTPWRLAVAVPGALTYPAAAHALARQLCLGWSRPPEVVLVGSDVTAWHAGGLRGRDGVVLAVGTGAAALGVRGRTVRRADGRGPLVGDEGGGAWIGLAGLRAAARAADGRGPATVLASLSTPADGGDELPSPAELAAHAPAVLAAADGGDQVAIDILDAAVDALATTARAAAGVGSAATNDLADPVREGSAAIPEGSTATQTPVAVVGGLAGALLPRLRRRHPMVTWTEPAGDALDGLAWLLDHADSALELGVVRCRPEPRRDAGADGATEGAGLPTEAAVEGAPATGLPSESAVDDASATGLLTEAATGGALGAEVDALPTEAPRPGSERIDLLPTAELVDLLVDGQAGAVPAVARAAGAVAEAVDHVVGALRRGGRLVYVGAGTPGRLALQDAAELTPTFGVDPDRVPTLLAGGPPAARAAVEGAEDDTVAGRAAVEAAGVGADDVVVGVSASGRTPFVRAALAAARERGAVTVAMVCTPNAPLAGGATVVIELPTGPEVLAGSTRLAAGTAQKVALNTLSTAAMVRTGATYGGWMVGVRASNAKLRRRAVRIVRDAAGVPEQTAARLVAEAAGDVRTALVSALTGLDVEAARRRLDEAGSVRAAAEGDGPVAARHAPATTAREGRTGS
jgi:N-acetylmuramic acid 6-phosphate etherase